MSSYLLEDLALDRVEQWAATGDIDVWAQAVALIEHALVDRDRLLRRAEAVEFRVQLAAVEWLAAEHAAGREIGSPQSYAAQRTVLKGIPAVASAVEGSRQACE